MKPSTLRSATVEEIPRLLEIQALSPQAAFWRGEDYQQLICASDPRSGVLVATAGNQIQGFLAYRQAVPDETEILNLAVGPGYRRQGVATALVGSLLACHRGHVFLEVRASNYPAIALYTAVGFKKTGRRAGYYRNPPEDAILMARAMSRQPVHAQ